MIRAGSDFWDRAATPGFGRGMCNGLVASAAGHVKWSEPLLRKQKEQVVSSLQYTVAGMDLMVVTHQAGLTVQEMTALRRRARDAGARFKVTKNRLAKRALDGTAFEGVSDLFRGPTAIAVSADPVAAAKVVSDYAATNDKLTIIGGSLAGKRLSPDEIMALAKLPSLDELRGKIVGMLQTPATRIAAVLAAPGAQVARVLNAYATKE